MTAVGKHERLPLSLECMLHIHFHAHLYVLIDEVLVDLDDINGIDMAIECVPEFIIMLYSSLFQGKIALTKWIIEEVNAYLLVRAGTLHVRGSPLLPPKSQTKQFDPVKQIKKGNRGILVLVSFYWCRYCHCCF